MTLPIAEAGARPAAAGAPGLPADQGGRCATTATRNELVSEQAGLAYPIRDGIPIMLVDEARPLDDSECVPREVRADDR